MKRCVLFMPQDHRCFEDVIRLLGRATEIVAIIDKTNFVSENSVLDLAPDLICSFLNHIIFRDAILELPNVNFHPAPPKYPGRGGASYALFNKDICYGATAHRMLKAVDTGEIYYTAEFKIESNDTCETLYAKGEMACLELLEQFTDHIRKSQSLPSPNTSIKWHKTVYTSKDFQEWLILDPEDKDGFELKIKAAKHSKFPGPYIIVNGHRFKLCD